MADISSENLFSRSARGFMHQVSEFVHVSAIYLGIAVLVTVVLSAMVPALRDQSQQIHTALLASLRPVALQDSLSGSAFGPYQDSFFSGADFSGSSSSRAAAPPASAPVEQPLPPVGKAGAAVEKPASPAQKPAPAVAIKSATPPETAASRGNVQGTLGRALSMTDAESIPGVSKSQVQALRSYIARKYQIAHNVSGVLIKTAFTVGKEKNLDPQLLLAVIAVESRYNPFAESHVGAQGLMQVMTKVHKDKFESLGAGSEAALNPIANIRVGSQILYDCIKRRGSTEGGLACYVGATTLNDGGYGAKVLAERRRIALASGIPIDRD